nr:auxilin-like protein [Tanacetum cinerariifolium]
MKLWRIKYPHDMVKDVFFDICRRVGISAKKQAPVGGKHACVDLTGFSPLVGLSSKGFTTGHAALKAASGKVTKHEKAYIENQHMFIPFAFDTFGFLAPEAVKLLRDEEEEYPIVNNYLSFQEEPIVLVEEESCPIYDTNNEEEEPMLVYDTDIEDVIEKEEGFVGKGGFGGEEDNIED